MSAARKMTPVACHLCGHNMWSESVVDGDAKVFTLSCINADCTNPGITERLHREPVTAWVCGPGPHCGHVAIGHVWAAS